MDYTIRITKWVIEVFGQAAMDLPERTRRLVEEVLEFAQAADLPRETAHRLVDYVYDRDKGGVVSELGGLSVALLAVYASLGESFDRLVQDELDRIETPEIRARSQRRAKEKAAQGF